MMAGAGRLEKQIVAYASEQEHQQLARQQDKVIQTQQLQKRTEMIIKRIEEQGAGLQGPSQS